MRIGASLFLIAVGAIMRFAVTQHVNGFDVQTAGVVLMVIGVIGLLLTAIFMSMRRRTDVIVQGNRAAYGDPYVAPPGTPVGDPYVQPGVRRTTYVEPADRELPY